MVECNCLQLHIINIIAPTTDNRDRDRPRPPRAAKHDDDDNTQRREQQTSMLLVALPVGGRLASYCRFIQSFGWTRSRSTSSDATLAEQTLTLVRVQRRTRTAPGASRYRKQVTAVGYSSVAFRILSRVDVLSRDLFSNPCDQCSVSHCMYQVWKVN